MNITLKKKTKSPLDPKGDRPHKVATTRKEGGEFKVQCPANCKACSRTSVLFTDPHRVQNFLEHHMLSIRFYLYR